MKLPKVILIVCCCVFISLNTSAQSGCLVNGTTNVYTTHDLSSLAGVLSGVLGYPIYTNPIVPQESMCINFSQTLYVSTSSNCGVCLSYFLGTCTNLLQGKIANATIIPCPIDDYTYVFALIAAGTGAYFISKKRYH